MERGWSRRRCACGGAHSSAHENSRHLHARVGRGARRWICLSKQPFCARISRRVSSAFFFFFFLPGCRQSADRRQTAKTSEAVRSSLPWSACSRRPLTATSTEWLCDLSLCFYFMFWKCQRKGGREGERKKKTLQWFILFALFFTSAEGHYLFRFL